MASRVVVGEEEEEEEIVVPEKKIESSQPNKPNPNPVADTNTNTGNNNKTNDATNSSNTTKSEKVGFIFYSQKSHSMKPSNMFKKIVKPNNLNNSGTFVQGEEPEEDEEVKPIVRPALQHYAQVLIISQINTIPGNMLHEI